MLWQSKDEQAVLKRTVFDGGFHAVLGLFDGKTGLWQFSLHLAIRFEDAVVDGRGLACMGDVNEACPVHDSGLGKPTHDRRSKGGIGVAAGEDGRRRPGRILMELIADHLRARTTGGLEQAKVFVMQQVEIDYECPGRIPGRCKVDHLIDLDDLEGYRCCSEGFASRRHQTVDTADFLIRRSGKDKNNISGDAGRASKSDLGHKPRRCRELNKVLCQFPTPSPKDETCFEKYSRSAVSVTARLHREVWWRARSLF